MSVSPLTDSPVWSALGWTILHTLWVGAAIGVLAALARWILKSARPEARYGVAFFGLLALSFSPVLIFVRVFEPDPELPIALARSLAGESRSIAWSTNSDRSLQARPEFRSVPLDRSVNSPRHSRLDFLVPYLPWFWLCGSLSSLAVLSTGLIGVERLRRLSRLVEIGDLSQRCRVLADSLGVSRRVSIGVCDRLVAPVLLGLGRPLILFPPAALSDWSLEQIEMVLLHELAHLRRWDNVVNLMQRLAESLLFFNPVVWWLSGGMRLERESCCDRLVVKHLGQPYAYAEILLALSGSSHLHQRAVLAMADRQVLTRIRRLLNLEDRSMKLTMPEGFGLLGAVIIGASLVLASQAAPRPPGSDSNEKAQQVQGTAVDDIKDMPKLEALPLSEREIRKDISTAIRRLKRVAPRNPRAIALFARNEGELRIVLQRATDEGVVTCRCRGGIKIVCNSATFGTIRMEADEAVIKRDDRRKNDEYVPAPIGQTYYDDAGLPMEVHLKGSVILVQDQDKIAGKGDQRTIRAHQLDYDFVTDRVLALDAELEVDAPGLETPIKIVSPRIEQFHPRVRQPDGSLASSVQREIRAGHETSPKPAIAPSPSTTIRAAKDPKP